MIKKTIKYTNFANEEVIEDFEFHISKAEFGKMELSGEGNSMTEYIKRISAQSNGKELIATVELIVDKAFGVRTPDGRGFDKSPEHLRAFKASGAYDALFEEMLMSENSADIVAQFVHGLFPSDVTAGVPDTAEGIMAAAKEQSLIPAGVRMPSDRQAKQEAPVDTSAKTVPFEGHIVDNTETVEELRARILEMESGQSGG